MRPSSLLLLSPVLLTACAGSTAGRVALAAPSTSPSTSVAPAAGVLGPAPCGTSSLRIALGAAQGTAGSTYQPIVLTNRTTTTCTLRGYPGVSYVAPGSGQQVGAAARRNPQHPVITVTLAPGARAEAVLQLVDHLNYPPAQCVARPVSGLRVYPPGSTVAAYVPFGSSRAACSTQVAQLTVEAVTPLR